jgi:hypothetical protein
MSRIVVAALLLALAPPSAFADEPAKKDPTAELLARLRKPLDVALGEEMQLQDFARIISDRYNVPVTVNKTAFQNIAQSNPDDIKLNVPKAKGLSLATVLRSVLVEVNATFLVRKNHIEIVPIQVAAKEAKIAGSDEDDGTVRLAQPLVSAIYKEKPLNEALADLAEEYDLTVVLAPQAGDAKAAFVNARLLNVPADRAIELLALQADLRVIKTGASYFVTTRDHASDLFTERREAEMEKIELERQRNSPFGVPPAPPAGPAPPARPGM